MNGEATNERLIGVDVGGTKVSVATLAGERLSEPLLCRTDTSSTDALLDQLIGLITAARDADPQRPAAAVGIAMPSVVEFATGTIRSSVNIPLRDVPLRELLHERLGLPVYVDNDATCAALAEAHNEHGKLDVRHLVMFTVGTGVGGGIVIDGRIYRGATGAAGELGHTLIGLDLRERVPDVPERFPKPGSLESLAAGHALDVLVARTAAAHPESALGRAAASGQRVAGPEAVAAARAGDADAIATIALLGSRLGVGIANAINTFDPDVVAIGGGASAAGELLLGPARETAMRYVLPGVGTGTEIRLARSGPEAGVRGAALLAGQELEAERAAAEPETAAR